MLKSLGKNRHGVITVFVVLIMVPVVVITGIMVDVARLKLFATQVAFASDSYGDVILSEYDNLLRELYGLFAVTQNETGLNAIEEYADYIGYSFKPNGNRSELSGSMFFSDADVSFEYEKIGTSSFANHNVLMTQIADYMEFRVVEQVLNETSVFDMIEGFKNMQNDNEAVAAVKDIGDNSGKVLDKIDKYYDQLVILKKYEKDLADLEKAIGAYGSKLAEIYSSGEHQKYREFIADKEAILEAKEQKEQLEAEGKEVSQSIKDKAAKYVDEGAYKNKMRNEINPKAEAVKKLLDADPFQKIPDAIDKLQTYAKDIEDGIEEIDEKLQILYAKLENASEDVKEGIKIDIEEMEKIQGLKGRFQAICDEEDAHNNKQNNSDNKTYLKGLYDELNSIKEDVLKGEKTLNTNNWAKSESDVASGVNWWNIPEGWTNKAEGKGELYTELHELHNDSIPAKNKKAADEKKDAANGKTDGAVDEINDEEEKTEARDIPSDVLAELKGCEATGDVPSFLDYFKDGFSFSNAGDAAAAIYDKFLMTEYDFGMFSSRVTGIKEKSEDDEDSGGATETIEEKNLNKAPMSKKINYLYGAELEYIYGGHAESKKNLAAARNTICGVRMTMNFISTYSIKEINSTISNISTAAAEAVAATGIGAAAAPLVKVAVSAALRAAVAALETVEDWKMLKNREDVLLFKSKLEDLSCLKNGTLTDLLGSVSKDSGGGSDTGTKTKRIEIKMSYEDYLRVLLFVCKSSDTITSRTSDLITLNVNQSQNSGDTLSAPLAFKMSDAYTAVKTTCKAKLEMVVVPDYMMDLFLGGNDTQTQIQSYDDGYIGYTMIRGY